MANSFLFTSESVSEGHPDKVADQISDAVLDAALASDSESRVACETLVTTNLVVVAGEITCGGSIDYEGIARSTVSRIGYDDPALGFDAESAQIQVHCHQQSADISRCVTSATDVNGDQGAGDQGMMFGYACDETPALMPLPIHLAHRLVERQAAVRRAGALPGLRPDAKSQVTVLYVDDLPRRIDTVVLSTQHGPEYSNNQGDLYEGIRELVIRPVLEQEGFDLPATVLVNPSGCFEIGGPHGDTGVTGRKIIVDTYGGSAPHGGGAFSGKDPSKVDRSAAYAARYVAKNIVAAGLARRCMIQLSYAIGRATPISVMFQTYGTGLVGEDRLRELVERHFDLRPAGIVRMLDLKRPIFEKTASYGHFGRNDPDFTWERLDKVAALKADAGV